VIQFRWILKLLIRVVVVAALASHLVIAVFYGWLSPKGFPTDHSRFWLNVIVPMIVGAAAVAGLAGALLRRRRVAAFAIVCMAAGWLAFATAGTCYFPQSLGLFWCFGLMVVALAVVLTRLLPRPERLPIPMVVASIVPCGLVGAFVAWAQIPSPPTTRPMGPLPATIARVDERRNLSPEPVGNAALFFPGAMELIVERAGVTIRCEPFLNWGRISPDGFWSLLAPDDFRMRYAVDRHFDGDVRTFHYSDGSTVELPFEPEDGSLWITSHSVVPEDSYAHLNRFCLFEITGHRRLSLAFSPCREELIEVLPSDYPFGRPARFAYVDETETLWIVEGNSGEKGPFRPLASGPLRRGEPLTISLFDEGQEFAAITLDDWTEQLSTAISPTAGWNVPVNAIEFRRTGDRPDDSVVIVITLAATSVGRGWETVGHRAGTYRNRLHFR